MWASLVVIRVFSASSSAGPESQKEKFVRVFMRMDQITYPYHPPGLLPSKIQKRLPTLFIAHDPPGPPTCSLCCTS